MTRYQYLTTPPVDQSPEDAARFAGKIRQVSLVQEREYDHTFRSNVEKALDDIEERIRAHQAKEAT